MRHSSLGAVRDSLPTILLYRGKRQTADSTERGPAVENVNRCGSKNKRAGKTGMAICHRAECSLIDCLISSSPRSLKSSPSHTRYSQLQAMKCVIIMQ